MTGVRIRAARPEDAAAIRAVARESWTDAYEGILDEETIDRKLDEWYDEEVIAESIDWHESAFLVAEAETSDDGAASVVGFAQAGPSEEDETAYVLYRIYVRPDQWGEGIGTRLLDQAIGAIRTEGAETLRLAVLAENDVGVGFYEARGFERVREKTSDVGEETFRIGHMGEHDAESIRALTDAIEDVAGL